MTDEPLTIENLNTIAGLHLDRVEYYRNLMLARTTRMQEIHGKNYKRSTDGTLHFYKGYAEHHQQCADRIIEELKLVNTDQETTSDGQSTAE